MCDESIRWRKIFGHLLHKWWPISWYGFYPFSSRSQSWSPRYNVRRSTRRTDTIWPSQPSWNTKFTFLNYLIFLDALAEALTVESFNLQSINLLSGQLRGYIIMILHGVVMSIQSVSRDSDTSENLITKIMVSSNLFNRWFKDLSFLLERKPYVITSISWTIIITSTQIICDKVYFTLRP